ncbi:AraC family transcriptional regulator [Acinetobacter sp. WZC-1]|uniref:AraC family transcriptional regulator n=1 Tax=Acinetobacter sp. WZC-1 TaxID=3459034 RepID=UPI00403D8DCB
MVKIEQGGGFGLTDTNLLKSTEFRNDRLASLGIEVINFSDIRAKISHINFATPERVTFYVLMLVTQGHGRHSIDFIEHKLEKNTLIFVKPNQVQQWFPSDPINSEIILLIADAIPSQHDSLAQQDHIHSMLEEWPAISRLTEHQTTYFLNYIQQLKADLGQYDGSNLDASLVRLGVVNLLLRIEKQLFSKFQTLFTTATHRNTYRLFKKELESFYSKEHNLQFYAQRLGYSQSTISRACIAAEGKSGKRVIDDRIILEAKRWLVHTSKSIHEISYGLGFSESTNFVKFFRKNTNETPNQFRDKMN